MLKKDGLSDADVFARVAALGRTRVLYDTAKGLALGLKIAQFILQVLACLFVALSHLAVWYFSGSGTEYAEEATPIEVVGPRDAAPVGLPSATSLNTVGRLGGDRLQQYALLPSMKVEQA